VRILVVGGGAREHVIAETIERGGGTVVAVMGNENPGVAEVAEEARLASGTDVDAVVDAARDWDVDLVAIGPEAPLEAGLVDALDKEGVPAASPTRAAARIETDKSFMRRLLDRHDVPGRLEYRVFESADGLADYVEETWPVAIKPAGLTGGKGVEVAGDHLDTPQDAVEYAEEVLDQEIGGIPRVLVEEKAVGEEFTLQAFTDGETVLATPALQDHKRAFEGGEGPNTGGMGSYGGPGGGLPWLPDEDLEAARETVEAIVDALEAEGARYRGTIYGQFMLTARGPKVIEVNARFGDPEAMNVLPLLETPFPDVLEAEAHGDVADVDVAFEDQATVCKYVVPEGYGADPTPGSTVTVDEAAIKEAGARVYYASVDLEERDGDTVRVTTTTSRSLALVGVADTIAEAEERVKEALEAVEGEQISVRHDIGKPEVVQERVERMRGLRD
jgi:phosphoribosylamine--glycine ligase